MQNERVDWPITRRALLQRSGLGLGMGLAGLLAEQAQARLSANPVDGQRRGPARSALRGKGETRYPLLLERRPVARR